MINNTDFATYIQQGETEITQENPFLVERVSLAIAANTANYILPDYCIKIRRVTWLGRKVIPLDERLREDIYQGLVLSTNEPVYYSSNLITAKYIKLHPVPSISLTNTGDSWTAPVIRTNCIVEFYRSADSSNTLPPYLRSRILRHYVGMRAYLREGTSQNLKASLYHRKRFGIEKKKFDMFLWDLYMTNKRMAINDIRPGSRIPFQPILPIDRFGTSVGDES